MKPRDFLVGLKQSSASIGLGDPTMPSPFSCPRTSGGRSGSEGDSDPYKSDACVLQQSISHLIWVFSPSMEPVCLGARRIRMRLLPRPDKPAISLNSFVSFLF